MLVDDQRLHVLTKFASLKGYRKKIESDHNSLFASFTLTFNVKKAEIRREIFDFKNVEGQKKFNIVTNF